MAIQLVQNFNAQREVAVQGRASRQLRWPREGNTSHLFTVSIEFRNRFRLVSFALNRHMALDLAAGHDDLLALVRAHPQERRDACFFFDLDFWHDLWVARTHDAVLSIICATRGRDLPLSVLEDDWAPDQCGNCATRFAQGTPPVFMTCHALQLTAGGPSYCAQCVLDDGTVCGWEYSPDDAGAQDSDARYHTHPLDRWDGSDAGSDEVAEYEEEAAAAAGSTY